MRSVEPIETLVDMLPHNSLTTLLLQGLDFVVPGEWKQPSGFDEMIQAVTGETDTAKVQAIREKAIQLYDDSPDTYQRVIWLYHTVDIADVALGSAAMANSVGEKVRFLSFLSQLTPKAEQSQIIDLSAKLIVEVIAYCLMNGLPKKDIGSFVSALEHYKHEALMRMSALICVDGIIPLGRDFVDKVLPFLDDQEADVEQHDTFQKIRSFIPGDNRTEQVEFMQNALKMSRSWINSFIVNNNLSADKVISHLQNNFEISEDKLEYLSAFIDMSTNYFAHTGTQTVARHVIRQAHQALS